MIDQWLRLLYIKGASLSQKHLLVMHLGSPESVFAASRSTISEILNDAGGRQFDIRLLKQPPSKALQDTIKQDARILDRIGAGFLPCIAERYPALLNATDGAPLGLFYAGDPDILNNPLIAMVGSRHASRGGRDTAQQFASAFCEYGFGIASGLALGIDTAAHQGALDAAGKTVAVIATGIDQVYPARNRSLHRAIVERGVVVSEFPPQTPPRRSQFPSRNRIISGLSLATLVVEAGIRSGSLITARLAAEQGRDVFAIPGSIYVAGSKGCHYLLKQGAGIAESPDDVLAELGQPDIVHRRSVLQKQVTCPHMDSDQQGIFALLDFTPCPVDQLIHHSGLTADQVSSILMQLELQGLVAESIGGYQRLPL